MTRLYLGGRRRTAWFGARFRRWSRWLSGETGGAVVLIAAALAALTWANIDLESYETLWRTDLSLRLGGHELSQDLRGWVNGGLMTFFFFVVGLEARREFDLGELRERARLVLPVAAGVAGMVAPVALYLAVTAGSPAVAGWGVAMSTDTALALGLLSLVGMSSPALRSFLLTVLVIDDLAALAVIAVFYTPHLDVRALFAAGGLLVGVLLVGALGVRVVGAYVVLGVGVWISLVASGLDPVVAGLVLGLLTIAYPAERRDLERATDLVRAFREQPTAESARFARSGVGSAISPNDRLQQLVSSWVTYLVVPVFALANTGTPLDGTSLSRAATSPITTGIVVGYVIGKPLGVVSITWLTVRVTRGRLRPPVGWAGVLGGGTSAGVGFTVALLIASLAFTGQELAQATLGVLATAVLSPTLTWLIFRAASRLTGATRARALVGTSAVILDLATPVDPERDHVRGPAEAPVTLVEYGDFECPFCGQAEPVVRELLAEQGDLRYVWRHLPLRDVHPQATLAAQASEAAAAQGAFWGMHDRLLDHQTELRPADLVRHALALDLDIDRFQTDLNNAGAIERISTDIESADASGVSGTPTFFVNGRRHHGAFDIEALTHDVKVARARALLT